MFQVDQHRRIVAGSRVTAYAAKAGRIASLVMAAGVNSTICIPSAANRLAIATKSCR